MADAERLFQEMQAFGLWASLTVGSTALTGTSMQQTPGPPGNTQTAFPEYGRDSGAWPQGFPHALAVLHHMLPPSNGGIQEHVYKASPCNTGGTLVTSACHCFSLCWRDWQVQVLQFFRASRPHGFCANNRRYRKICLYRATNGRQKLVQKHLRA